MWKHFGRFLALISSRNFQKINRFAPIFSVVNKRSKIFPRMGYNLIFPVAYAVSLSSKNEIDDCIEKSDKLFDGAKFKESCDVLDKFKDVDNDEVLWRLSRGLYNMTRAENVTKDEIKKLITQADELITRALAINQNNYAVHKWRAIILGEKTTLEGTKAKLASLPQFKEHVERAIALNPSDPTSIHMLGVYFYNISDLAWYQKKIASALFGKVPDASFQEALAAFNKAEETSPNFYSANLLMLGKTYMKLGMTDLAKHWLQRAASYTAKTDDDKAVTKEAADLLKTF